MKIINLLVFILILLASCQPDSNITSSSSPDNSLLSTKIIGTWENSRSNGSIVTTYNTDFTFIDSIFYIDETDTSNKKLMEIRGGTYKIISNIIKYEKLYVSFFDTSSNIISFTWVPFNKELHFPSDSLLFLRAMDILYPLSKDNNDIWGNWANVKWIYNYSRFHESNFYAGRVKYTYSFNKDSIKYEYTSEYLGETSLNGVIWKLDYSYNQSRLDLSGGFKNIEVLFKGGFMYWYYDFEPIEFRRKK